MMGFVVGTVVKLVGSRPAFGSIGHVGSNPSTPYVHFIMHQPSASLDHGRIAHFTIQFVGCCSSLI